MGIIKLSSEIELEICTWNEAEALRGLLVEGKYKEIRIGELFLKSMYTSEKEAFEKGKREYQLSYLDYSRINLMPVSVVQPVTNNITDKDDNNKFESSSVRKTADGIMTIDVESVLKQLEEVSLNHRELGSFVALEWNNTIRTVLENDILIAKFYEEAGNDGDNCVSAEWIKYRGNFINDIRKRKRELGEWENITEWVVDYFSEEYYLSINFGDEGFTDCYVSLIRIPKEDEELDPYIEEAMILGGCWD